MLLAVAFPWAFSSTLEAQSYPFKPVRMLVPFPPGGPADIIARAAAAKAGDGLGQPIVVENRGGGGGNIAAEAVVRAAPDGYTILLLSSGVVANQSLYAKLSFNLVRDLSPIAGLGSFPLLLVAHPSTGIKTVQDLVAAAKARPGELNYGSAGAGGGAHLAAESFRIAAAIAITHIPYKGTGPAVADLVGGQVNLMFGSVPSVLQHVRAGRLNAIGVTSARRSSALPTTPTIAESGVAGYEITSWFGVAGPAGLPEEIATRLNSEFRKAAGSPEFMERLNAEAGEALNMSVAQFGEFMKSESVRWAKVVRDSGVKLD